MCTVVVILVRFLAELPKSSVLREKETERERGNLLVVAMRLSYISRETGNHRYGGDGEGRKTRFGSLTTHADVHRAYTRGRI